MCMYVCEAILGKTPDLANLNNLYLSKEMLFASILSTLSAEKRLSSRLEIRVLALCVNHSLFMLENDTTSILFYGFGKARITFLPAQTIISNANSAAVQNKLTFFLLARIIFNFLFRQTQPDARWPLLA